MGTDFSSHCPSLKLKCCTAEKMPWKYNPLHSRKINKQGHPNFQLVLVQSAGNGKRSVPGAPGRVVDTAQGQEGWKGMPAQCEDGPSPRKTADQRGDVTPEAGGGHHVLPTELPGSMIRGFSAEVALESSANVIYLKPKLPERSQYRPHTEF